MLQVFDIATTPPCSRALGDSVRGARSAAVRVDPDEALPCWPPMTSAPSAGHDFTQENTDGAEGTALFRRIPPPRPRIRLPFC